MKNNDIFNFRRFGRYFASDIRTCTANYGLSLATISLLILGALYICTVAISLIFNGTWQGPGIGFRMTAFMVAMLCIVVTMPAKCYGRLTEKQYGSEWLMVPASGLEKFLSMLIITLIIGPVIGIVLFLGLDAIICALDATCGQNLTAFFTRAMSTLNTLLDEGVTSDGIVLPTQGVVFIKNIMDPWLWIDELPMTILPFVLGAICFKNGKTVKTILVIMAAGMITSIAMSPVMMEWVSQIPVLASENPAEALERLDEISFFRNIKLTDTISDTITNIALIAGIWFRIKTMKH